MHAADYEKMDQLSNFFEEIVDFQCWNSETAHGTAVFRWYVFLNNCTHRRLSNPGWIEYELLALELQINSFRNGAKEVFGRYQQQIWWRQSGMIIHILGMQSGKKGIAYLDAGSFETSTKSFKMRFKRTSRKANCHVWNFEANIVKFICQERSHREDKAEPQRKVHEIRQAKITDFSSCWKEFTLSRLQNVLKF